MISVNNLINDKLYKKAWWLIWNRTSSTVYEQIWNKNQKQVRVKVGTQVQQKIMVQVNNEKS